MFDIGFPELVLVAVIALIVIGPERLPEVARTVGKYVGRMRRFVSKVRDDIDREVRQEELRAALKRNADLDEIKNIINDTRYTIEDEVTETKQHVVDARDDDPRGDFSQKDLLKEQEEEFDKETYGLTDHSDYGAEERAADSGTDGTTSSEKSTNIDAEAKPAAGSKKRNDGRNDKSSG